jgi:hypothetical protein
MAGKIFDSGKVGLGTGVTCTSFTELNDSAKYSPMDWKCLYNKGHKGQNVIEIY